LTGLAPGALASVFAPFHRDQLDLGADQVVPAEQATASAAPAEYLGNRQAATSAW